MSITFYYISLVVLFLQIFVYFFKKLPPICAWGPAFAVSSALSGIAVAVAELCRVTAPSPVKADASSAHLFHCFTSPFSFSYHLQYIIVLCSRQPFFALFYQSILLGRNLNRFSCYTYATRPPFHQRTLLRWKCLLTVEFTHTLWPSIPLPPPCSPGAGLRRHPSNYAQKQKGQKAFQPCSSFFVSFLPRPPTKNHL